MRVLISIWLVLCIVLASTVILDPLGAMTPDSANYCRVASGMLAGNGPTVTVGTQHVWYTSQPPAYPAAIAVVGFVTNVSTFWASKIVQMLCMLGIVLMMRKPLQEHVLVVVLLLVCDAWWTLFLYSWSEPLFILCCIAMARAVASAWERPRVLTTIVMICAASVGVLTRYSGIALPAVLLAAVILALIHGRSAWKHYAVALLVSSLVLGTDLWMNITYGGNATGIRQSASEPFVEILTQLALAIVRPLVFLPVPNGPLKLPLYATQAVMIVGGLVLVVRGVRRSMHGRSLTTSPLVRTLVGLGLLVTGTTVLPRFALAMDPIGLRFVAPGALLIALGLVCWWKEQGARLPRATTTIMVISIVLACGTAVRTKSWLLPNSGARTYMSMRDSVLRKYAAVEDSSIVLFGNDHIRYLRPSVHTEYPQTTPWFHAAEPMNDFRDRLRRYPTRAVYMDSVRDVDTYHPSVRAFADSMQYPSAVVRLW